MNGLKALIVSIACVWLVGAAQSARAQATINECEKIQAADAYNQCLAKFGPPAKSGNLEPERPGDIKSSSAEAAATAGRPSRGRSRAAARRHRGHGHATGHVARARHSRKTLSIPVK